MPCTRPIHGWMGRGGKFTTSASSGWSDRRQSISCGQCLNCKIERSRQWSARILKEALMHEKSSFITLTYEDKKIPPNNSLKREDITLFLKRLRKSLSAKNQKIRYYICGEYGETTNRPHYHAIIFNYWPNDSKFLKNSKHSDRYYHSDTLDKIWQKGYCLIGELTFESASYTTSYVTKVINGPNFKAYYNKFNKEPEFATMSNQHGIAYEYYQKYKKEIWDNNSIVINGQESSPPQNFKILFRQEDEKGYENHQRLHRSTDSPWFSEWHDPKKEKRKRFNRSKYSNHIKQFFKKNTL